MNREEILFERFFGRNDEHILNSSERSLARIVYGVACGKIHDDDSDSDDDEPDDDSDDDGVEATKDIFKHVIELLKISKEKRNAFLQGVHDWLSVRKINVRRLKEIAEEIQNNKFNSNIARVVGGVVGGVGGVVAGVCIFTPLAAVALPLAIGAGVAALGGGVIVGTEGTEVILLKNKLEEVKTVVKQEKSISLLVNQWFTHIADLQIVIESLINYNILKEMSDDVQKFLSGRTRSNMAIGELKNRFKHASELCLRRMCKFSNIKEKFGNKIAPIVMTFIFMVCLMRDDSRSVLDSVMITHHFGLGLLEILGFRTAISRTVFNRRFLPMILTRMVAIGPFLAGGIIIDIINVVQSSIHIHKRTESVHARQIKKAAEELETACLLIESYFYEFNSCKSITWTDVSLWKSVTIQHVPNDVGQVDIKRAVQPYLPEENMGFIKFLRLPTDRNNWLVMLPACHSQKLLRQSHIIIKEACCLVTN